MSPGGTGLAGRIAIVTGGTHGLGGDIADALLAEGATVVRTTRARPGPTRTGSGPRDLSRQLDVRDPEAVRALVEQVVRDLGRVDILVSNAGVSRPGPVDGMDDAAWTEVIETNLTGTFNSVRAVVPFMRRAGSGSIITLSSALGSRPTAMAASYCASKAGIEMLTKVVAVELGGDGVRVNCLAPGFIDTGMGRELAANQTVWPAVAPKLVSGRLGTGAEVGSAVVFLASDSGSYVNGQVLEVTGGLRW